MLQVFHCPACDLRVAVDTTEQPLPACPRCERPLDPPQSPAAEAEADSGA